MSGAISFSSGPSLPGSFSSGLGREFYEIGPCPSGGGYCQRINGGPWTPYNPIDVIPYEFEPVPDFFPTDFGV